MPFPRSLTTTPIKRSGTGRFEACSCKPTPGGRLPSSVQHHEISLVFVTHTIVCPSSSGASRDRARRSGSWSTKAPGRSSRPRSFPSRCGCLSSPDAGSPPPASAPQGSCFSSKWRKRQTVVSSGGAATPRSTPTNRHNHRRLVQRLFHARVGEIEPLLQEVSPQHEGKTHRTPAIAGLRICGSTRACNPDDDAPEGGQLHNEL